jgi:trehalose 6-phosphate synthase complex regulatory subunit
MKFVIYRKDPEVLEWIGVLREKYNGKKLVVARDKLDYVKGVRQKMLAFEIFLTRYPEWQERVSLNIDP